MGIPWESLGNPTGMGIHISVHTSSSDQRRELSQRDRATRSLPVTFNQRVAGNDDGRHTVISLRRSSYVDSRMIPNELILRDKNIIRNRLLNRVFRRVMKGLVKAKFHYAS